MTSSHHRIWARTDPATVPSRKRSTLESGMRFEQLRYLQCIVRHRSFRRAAEELRLSQPSLTQAMQSLEEELQVVLLDRQRGDIRLTAAGEEVMPDVLHALECETRMRKAGDEYAFLRKGILSIGTTHAGSNTALPAMLSRFSQRYPGIDIHVVEGGSVDITGDVRDRKLDIGIITRVPGVTPPVEGMRIRDLVVSHLVVCIRRDNSLASRQRTITAADLAGQSLIMFRRGYALHDAVRALVAESNPRVVFHTNNPESAKRMVVEGLGITVMPKCSVVSDNYLRQGKIRYIPVRDSHASVIVSAIQRQGEHASKAAEVFWNMLPPTRAKNGTTTS